MAPRKPRSSKTTKRPPQRNSRSATVAHKEPASTPDPLAMVVTKHGEVAAHFGISRDVVRRDWKAAGMPAYPCTLGEIEAWRQTLKERPDEFADRSKDVMKARVEKILAEARHKIAAAEASEYKMRLLNDNIVQLDAVERFLSDLFTEARQILKRIPQEIKAGYPAEWREELAADIDARIDLALRAMHGQAETLVDLRESG